MDHTYLIKPISDSAVSDFMTKVYSWMAGALSLSALVAWQAAGSEAFMGYLIERPWLFYGILIAELILVVVLASRITHMSLTAAIIAFLAYSILTGLSLSTIFLVYTSASIAKTFIVAAGMFGVTGLYGYTTKRDLSAWGSFLVMSLIGIIIASVVNLFLHSPMIEWMVTYGGIIIFVGLAAWDTQKLKAIGSMGYQGDALGKAAIMGALSLYLDFINLFLLLLRAMGNRR